VTLIRPDLAALDKTDPLRPFRDRFALPQGVIYLDGNSLGAMPRATAARVAQVIEAEWGRDLITSWNKHGWMELPGRIGDKIGRLIGARPGETMVGDSTSVNLFKALAAALKLRPDRRIILSEPANFPTDLYIAEGLAALLAAGHELRLVEPDAIEAAITDEVAVVMLTHVNYRTGRMHDLARITAKAQAADALMLWDLAHSAGAVPVDLTGAGADLAVGCGYKYLNGGPGAPAFLWVAERWHGQVAMPLTGWLGHAAPFAFETSFRPAEGIARGLVGTPPILSLAALECGVDILLDASMAEIRAKSLRQSALFAELIEQELAGHGFRLVSPREDARRGSQVCIAHEQGYPIMQALIARGVIGDFRAPDRMRFGFTPLYLGADDVLRGVAIIAEVIASRSWDAAKYRQKALVT
jgi:kynureninase